MNPQTKENLIDLSRGFLIGSILLIIVVIILTIFGCSDGSSDVIVTDPSPPPQEIPEDPPENNPVKLTLYSDTAIKFYDGDIIWTWKTGNVKKAESQKYTYSNIIYNLDEYGDTDSTKYIITIPDIIRLDNSDVWISKNIPPAEAQKLGALPKDYTKIYLNSDEYGNWFEREYKASNMIIYKNDVFVKSEIGNWYHINGDMENIKTVIKNGFVIYDFDGVNKKAKIDGIDVSWATNFFNSANYWLESDKWYSQNGYTWDGFTLVENGSIMTDWRMAPYITGYTEAPVLISAGRHFENSEYILYWIECNSGWVIRYIPSLNQMNLHVRLYMGDGLRVTGLYYQNLLKPVIIGDYLYFIFDAQVYRYCFTSGLTALFASGVSGVCEY